MLLQQVRFRDSAEFVKDHAARVTVDEGYTLIMDERMFLWVIDVAKGDAVTCVSMAELKHWKPVAGQPLDIRPMKALADDGAMATVATLKRGRGRPPKAEASA